MTLPAMVAKPPMQIALSSDRVILEIKGRINSSASLCNKEAVSTTLMLFS